MLIPVFLAALIEAVLSSPINYPGVLYSTPLKVLGRSIVEQCTNTTNTRSLYTILRSCAATTFACTWISMHRNVPGPGKSSGRLLLERALLLDYAVIAPECVTIWAYRQHQAAARHAEKYNARFNLESESQSLLQFVRHWLLCPRDEIKSLRPWTVTHGFLLEMRALVILRDGQPPQVVEDVDQLPGPFDISLDQINDKSKRDSLAKLLVIFQTSFFVLQCIARWAQRLDVTELETLTLAFAFLNVLTYIFWWYKPQDMSFPIQIDLRSSPATRMSGVRVTDKHCGCIPNTASSSFEKIKQESVDVTVHSAPATPRSPLSPQNPTRNKHTSSPAKRSWWMTILHLPVLGLRLFRLYFVYPFYVMCESKTSYENTSTGQLFYTSAEGLSESPSPKHWLSLCLATFIFGGIHFIPVWLSYFPTQVERWIWFGCSVWVAAHPVITLVEKLLSTFSWGPKYVVNGQRRRFPESVRYGFPVYGGARICFLLLALLALRELPCKAFEEVQWATFVPHI